MHFLLLIIWTRCVLSTRMGRHFIEPIGSCGLGDLENSQLDTSRGPGMSSPDTDGKRSWTFFLQTKFSPVVANTYTRLKGK